MCGGSSLTMLVGGAGTAEDAGAACEVSVLETGGRLTANLESDLETCDIHHAQMLW